MSRLEREILQKFEDTKARLLQGDAPDYAKYCALVERYSVLKELTDFAADLRKEPPSLGDPEDE